MIEPHVIVRPGVASNSSDGFRASYYRLRQSAHPGRHGAAGAVVHSPHLPCRCTSHDLHGFGTLLPMGRSFYDRAWSVVVILRQIDEGKQDPELLQRDLREAIAKGIELNKEDGRALFELLQKGNDK